MTRRIAGVVLAGGASRRMGQAKTLLALPDGITFLEHALAKLASVTDLQLVVGGDADTFPAAIRNLQYIQDIHPGLGPLSGIEAALRSELGDGYLVIATDQIRLQAEMLAFLLTGDTDRTRAFRIDGVIIPLPIYLPQWTLNKLVEILQSESRSLRRFIEASDPLLIELTVENLVQFESVNTPEDYQIMLNRWSSKNNR